MEDARDAVTVKKDDRNQQGREIEFADPVKFLSSVLFSELPETPVLLAQKTLTTIDVLNTTRVRLQNTGAVSVTDLTQGSEGQLVILLGDGFTTLVNNSSIGTNTGANKLLAAGAAYFFTRLNSKWIENAASGTITAGAGISVSGSTVNNLYVGKHVTVLGSNVTHTAILGAGYDPFGPVTGTIVRVVADCTGMTQYRIMARQSASTGNTSYRLGYATTLAGAATNISAVTISINGENFNASAFATLPVGARIASCYLTIEILQATTGNTATLEHFSVELKP